MTLYNGVWYVGGDFTSANGGVTRTSVAAFDQFTGALKVWDAGLNTGSAVYGIQVVNGIVYLAGTFSSVNGITRNNIAAVDSTFGNPTSWNPNVNGEVDSLYAKGTTLYFGGAFTTVGGTTRNHVAAISTGGILGAWNPNIVGSTVRSIIQASATSLYLGGTFSNVGGASRGNKAEVDSTYGVPTSWNPGLASGETNTRAMAETSKYVYVACDSTLGIQVYDRIYGATLTWNPGVNSAPFCLAPVPGIIFLGGQFTTPVQGFGGFVPLP